MNAAVLLKTLLTGTPQFEFYVISCTHKNFLKFSKHFQTEDPPLAGGPYQTRRQATAYPAAERRQVWIRGALRFLALPDSLRGMCAGHGDSIGSLPAPVLHL